MVVAVKEKAEKTLMVLGTLIIIIVLLGAGFHYFYRQEHEIDWVMEAELYRHNGDYVILITDVEPDAYSFSRDSHFLFTNGNGNLTINGSLWKILEKNPDFLDENFVPVNNGFRFIDVDRNLVINCDDIIVIRGVMNGGPGCENSLFSLYGGRYDDDRELLTISLEDELPVYEKPERLDYISPRFTIENNSDVENFSVQIDTDHVAIDSYYKYSSNFDIGITLKNENPEVIENISIRISSCKKTGNITYEIVGMKENITIDGNSRVRFLFNYASHPLEYKEIYSIYAEILEENRTHSIIARTEFQYLSYS